jgi:protein-S-isoprenylcysteine O-methyltransferase Ste14
MFRYLEKILIFSLGIYSIWTLRNATSFSVFEIISKLLKPVLIIFLIFTSKPFERRLDLKSCIGILLSFGSVLLFKFDGLAFSKITLTFIFVSLVFYIAMGIVGIINLGRAFTILPSASYIVTKGLYSHISHPIYSSYIHFFTLLTISNLSIWNVSTLFFFCFGIILRCHSEETLLAEFSDEYSNMQNKNRFFGFHFTLPLLIPILFIFFYERNAPKEVSINLGEPILSLSPIQADDWSSFFIINHIYPRLSPKEGEFRSNSIFKNKSLNCKNKSISILSNDCRTIQVNYEIRESTNCNRKKYDNKVFKRELSLIAAAKPWLLPEFNWCKDDSSCFEIASLPQLQHHLESIYLRFGWANENQNDESFGIYPNCFKPQKKTGSQIDSGILTTERWKIEVAVNSSSPDIFLYENASNSQQYNNLSFYNPVYYFLIIRDSKNELSTDKLEAIKNEFIDSGLISNMKGLDLLESNFFESSKISSHKKLNKIVLPNFLFNCHDLGNSLQAKLKIKFECLNISEYINSVVKMTNNWEAFITPVTPGLPGKNALKTQYFSSGSSDSWISRNPKISSTVYLLGKSDGKLSVKKGKFCKIKPNSLGLSNLTIDDFIKCQ